MYLLIALVFMVALHGCREQVDQSELQKAYIDQKIEDYRAYQKRKCQEKITEMAQTKADSFFIAMAKKQTFDSIERPSSFLRPRRPEVSIREDSVPLSPLIKPDSTDRAIRDSMRRDSGPK
jgi:hypothetical protein